MEIEKLNGDVGNSNASIVAKNSYDKLSIDVPSLYLNYPFQMLSQLPKSTRISEKLFFGIYRTRLLPLKIKRAVWTLLRRIHLDQSWFERFQSYWSDVLKARPLWSPEDVYFLRNWCRISFQNVGFEGEVDSKGYLQAWKKSKVIFENQLGVSTMFANSSIST